jgi:hypothetical protein
MRRSLASRGRLWLLLCLAMMACHRQAPPRHHIYAFTPGNEVTPARSDTPYSIASGYLRTALNAALNGTGETFDIVDTTGSYDALLRLAKEADDTSTKGVNDPKSIAMVQADVLYHYLNGGHPLFPLPHQRSKIRAIAPLFPEYVLLTVPNKDRTKPDLVPDANAILNVPAACAGPRGSGTIVTATNLGRVLQAPWSNEIHDCDPQAKLESEAKVASHIHLSVLSLPDLSTAGLCSPSYTHLTSAQAQVMVAAYRPLYQANPLTTLCPQIRSTSLEVVSVNAFLVASADLADSVVDQLRQALAAADTDDTSGSLETRTSRKALRDKTAFNKLTEIRQKIFRPAVHGLDLELPIALHKRLRLNLVAGRVSNGLAWAADIVGWPTSVFVLLTLIAALGLILFWSSISMTRALRRYRMEHSYRLDYVASEPAWVEKCIEMYRLMTHRRRIFGVVMIAMLSYVGLALTVWLIEYSADSLGPETSFSVGGLQYALVTLIPKVMQPRYELTLRSEVSDALIQAFRWVAGILFTVVVTYGVQDWIRRWLMSKRLVEQVLLIGKSPRLDSIVAELGRRGIPVDTMLQGGRGAGLPEQTAGPWGRGPARRPRHEEYAESVERQLREKNWDKSNAIIVLADEDAARDAGFGDADLWVLSVVDGIARLEREHNVEQKRREMSLPRLHVVAEVLNGATRSLIHVTRPGTEVTCGDRFDGKLISHAVSIPGVVEALDELLRTDEPKNGNGTIEADTGTPTMGLENSLRVVKVEMTADPRNYGEVRESVEREFRKKHARACVVGIVASVDGRVRLNPSLDIHIGPEDAVVVITGRDSSRPGASG